MPLEPTRFVHVESEVGQVRENQVLFGGEVSVENISPCPGYCDDVSDAGAIDAALVEQLRAGTEDPRARLAGSTKAALVGEVAVFVTPTSVRSTAPTTPPVRSPRGSRSSNSRRWDWPVDRITRNLGAIRGIMRPALTFSTALGPLVIAALYDLYGSYVLVCDVVQQVEGDEPVIHYQKGMNAAFQVTQ